MVSANAKRHKQDLLVHLCYFHSIYSLVHSAIVFSCSNMSEIVIHHHADKHRQMIIDGKGVTMFSEPKLSPSGNQLDP